MTPEQKTEIHNILARMSILSDARGVSYIPSGHAAKHESTGTQGPRARDQDQDLYTKWVQRFANPDNAERIPTLILLAKRELGQRTQRQPVPIGDHGEREDSWERDARIIEWYENVPAEEAALMESASGHCTASNIRKVRVRNERDPALGKERVPQESRQRVARQLRAEGQPIRKIAREMNVAPSTVQRLLASNERKAA